MTEHVAANSEVEYITRLEAVVLRAKVCEACSHPNAYEGQYPHGGWPKDCRGCGWQLPAEGQIEDLGEIAKSDPFIVAESEPRSGFFRQLADAWRRGLKEGR